MDKKLLKWVNSDYSHWAALRDGSFDLIPKSLRGRAKNWHHNRDHNRDARIEAFRPSPRSAGEIEREEREDRSYCWAAFGW
jgi:hypothetical protein